jgi:hypothetical protein
MKTLSFYIVFHKKIYEDNTKSFHPEHMKHSLKWVAVNENVEKEYTDYIPPECLIKEWEMTIHNPLYQMTNFYQNSVFLHIYWNKLYENSKYIGFAQYDMSIDASELLTIETTALKQMDSIVCAAFIYNADHLINLFTKETWVDVFVNPYNTFYNTSHTIDSLKELPLFLLHTFIIPSWFFKDMMPFIERIIPIILRKINWDTRHLAGTLERVFALCISCGMLEGRLKTLIQMHGIKNLSNQREEDLFRGIKKEE